MPVYIHPYPYPRQAWIEYYLTILGEREGTVRFDFLKTVNNCGWPLSSLTLHDNGDRHLFTRELTFNATFWKCTKRGPSSSSLLRIRQRKLPRPPLSTAFICSRFQRTRSIFFGLSSASCGALKIHVFDRPGTTVRKLVWTSPSRREHIQLFISRFIAFVRPVH